MDVFNLILGIVASIFAIISALYSKDTNKKISKIYKTQSGDNSISSSGDKNEITQKNILKK